MMEIHLLTIEKINDIMKELLPEQQAFMSQFSKRTQRSKWLEILAAKKGIVTEKGSTTEELAKQLDDWELVEVLDAGLYNRPYKCECGASLRHQYIVEHRTKGKVYKLGKTCLESYTGISNKIVDEIAKELNDVNLHRDDLLLRMKDGEVGDLTEILERYSGMLLPEDIQQQLKCLVPLHTKQVEKLDKNYRVFQHGMWRKQIKEAKNREAFQPSSKAIVEGYFMNPSIPSTTKKKPSWTYNQIITTYSDVIDKIKELEHKIPAGLKKDWESIQNALRDAKNGQDADLESVRLKVENLKIPLHL